MSGSITLGVHHVGLTVSDLDASTRFFTDYLGWSQVGGNADYPANFVSDGTVMVTLWLTRGNGTVHAFNKDNSVGLHHLAIRVVDLEALNNLYKRLQQADDVIMEFAPELLGEGPTRHMMCYEPSGNRIEFIVPA